jgi:hypothetical protein
LFWGIALPVKQSSHFSVIVVVAFMKAMMKLRDPQKQKGFWVG